MILEEIAKKALSFVEKDMIIGLGTGRAATAFIGVLAKQGMNLKCIASSKGSEELARMNGLKVVEEAGRIDVVFDGADKIDRDRRMIKGGGGALLREKILASSAKKMIVLVTEEKLVDSLEGKKLPIEIVPFGYKFTELKLKKLGFKGEFRIIDDKLFKTDNENFIFDVEIGKGVLEEMDKVLRSVPGVVETGFFFNFATKIVVGFKDNHIEIV